MAQSHQEVFSAEEASLYLRSRLGDIAPLAETLREWSTPSYRKRHAATVSKRRTPRGIVVEGTKRRAWSRGSLDIFADAIIAEVTRHDPVPEPAGERQEAPA